MVVLITRTQILLLTCCEYYFWIKETLFIFKTQGAEATYA
jgi:hypothetical protein